MYVLWPKEPPPVRNMVLVKQEDGTVAWEDERLYLVAPRSGT